MGVNEQNAAQTLMKLGIKIPGLPGQEPTGPTVSRNVLEGSPSLAFGATPDEHTGYVDQMRAQDVAANAPGLAEADDFRKREQEAYHQGFEGIKGASKYAQQQVEADRRAKIEASRVQGESSMDRMMAQQEFQRQQAELKAQADAAKQQAALDAAKERDTHGTPSDAMYKSYNDAKATAAQPEGIMHPFTYLQRHIFGRDDKAAVTAQAQSILDRRGELLGAQNAVKQLGGVQGRTVSERLAAMGLEDDLDEFQRTYIANQLGLPE